MATGRAPNDQGILKSLIHLRLHFDASPQESATYKGIGWIVPPNNLLLSTFAELVEISLTIWSDSRAYAPRWLTYRSGFEHHQSMLTGVFACTARFVESKVASAHEFSEKRMVTHQAFSPAVNEVNFLFAFLVGTDFPLFYWRKL